MKDSKVILKENKELVCKVMAAISDADWKFVEDTFAEEASIWVAGEMPISGTHTKDFVRSLGEGNKVSFPNGLSLKPKAMTAEGDRVAIEAETLGKHASGKTYNNHFHFMMVIRDGKIYEWKEYMDTKHASLVFFGE